MYNIQKEATMQIGLRIKECREKMGYSQTDLANLLGINRANVGMWESFKNRPKIEDIIRLSNIFMVSVDFLLGLDKSNHSYNSLDSSDKEVLEIFRKLDVTGKAKVLGYAKARLDAQAEIKDIKVRTGYRAN